MADTLTGLAREIHALELAGADVDPADAHALALRLEQYETDLPAGVELDPDTRLNLLTRLARTLTPRCPRRLDAARSVLGLPQEVR